MSTFHPAASSLANCNDTILTISTIDSSSTLAVLIKTRTNVWHGITAHTFWGLHGEHQVNTESLHQRVKTQCSGGFKISTFHPVASSLANFNGTIIKDLYYDSTLLSCTHATKEASRFWGWGNPCIRHQRTRKRCSEVVEVEISSAEPSVQQASF